MFYDICSFVSKVNQCLGRMQNIFLIKSQRKNHKKKKTPGNAYWLKFIRLSKRIIDFTPHIGDLRKLETSFSTTRCYRDHALSNFSFVLDNFPFQNSTKCIWNWFSYFIWKTKSCGKSLHFGYNVCAMMPWNASLCSRTSIQRRARGLAKYDCYNEVLLYQGFFPYV